MAEIQAVIQAVRQRLEPASESAGLDAQVLLAHILGRPRAWVLAHPEAVLSMDQMARLEAAVRRLERGEPLPYVLGHWEFFGLAFVVSPAALIPRPETELLVERALDWLHENPERRLACDAGTGSGAIAIALAVHIPDLRVLATDISWPALQLAQENVRRHAVAGRVFLQRSDLLPATSERLDLICANLPYIPSERLPALQVYGREPELALDGGPDGLSLIARLLGSAPDKLAPGGLVLLEIDASQGTAVLDLARQAFPQAEMQVHADLTGRQRLVEIRTKV